MPLPSITTGKRPTRTSINSFIPLWMSNRPFLNTAFKLIWSFAVICDAMLEQVGEGFMAAFPGVGTNTALPFIGYARGLIQGPNEPDSNFIKRLIGYLAAYNDCGSPEQLVKNVQAYLWPASGPLPTVRLVDRNANWCSINPAGVITKTIDAAWNWDGVSHPWHNTVPTWWSDIWIIVNPSRYTTYADLADPNFIAAFGNASNGNGLGHMVGRQDVSNILQIVKNWRGGHNYVQAIIWCTDPALFVPGSLGVAGNPDGTWGNWSKKDASGNRIPSRTTATGGGTVRYWTPGASA